MLVKNLAPEDKDEVGVGWVSFAGASWSTPEIAELFAGVRLNTRFHKELLERDLEAVLDSLLVFAVDRSYNRRTTVATLAARLSTPDS